MALRSPLLAVIALTLAPASLQAAGLNDFLSGTLDSVRSGFAALSGSQANSCTKGEMGPLGTSGSKNPGLAPGSRFDKRGEVSCYGENPVTERTERMAGGKVCSGYQGLRPNSRTFGQGRFAAFLNGGNCTPVKKLLDMDLKTGRVLGPPRWLCIEARGCTTAALPVDSGPRHPGRVLDASGGVCGDLKVDLRKSGKGDPFLESVPSAHVFDCSPEQAQAYIRNNPCHR